MGRAAGKLVKFFLWTYIAYLAVSLFIVLPALNILAPWGVREYLGRELRHEIVIFNPFTLSLEMRGVSVHEPDGHVPLAFTKAGGSLSVASLWRPGVVLDWVRVEELDVHVLRYADGSFHFDDLLTGESEDEAPASEMPGITIDSIFLDAHTLRYTDRTRPGPYSAAYSDFSVAKEDLSTLPERSGNGQLTLVGADGGTISWRGEVAIADGFSTGFIEITDFDLTHLWRYEAERLHFVTRSAKLDFGMNYRVEWSDVPRFTFSDGHVRLHDLDLVPADPEALPDTRVALADFLVSDISGDSDAQQVTLGNAQVRGLQLDGFNAQEQVSLVELFDVSALTGDAAATSAAADEASAAAEAPDDSAGDPAGNPAGDSAWRIGLAQFSLADSAVRWRSSELAPELITIRPLRVSASDIHWPATGDSAFALALRINDAAGVDVDGSIDIGSGDGTARYDLATLPLAWLNPLVNRGLRADINGGLLSVEGSVELSAFAPQSAATDVQLDDFAMQIHGADETALNLAALTVSGANVDMAGSAVDISDITLRGLRGALHILEDGSLNISTALIEEPAAGAADETGDAGAAGEAGETNEVDLPGADAAPPWAIRIAHFGVRDGRLDFSDASLPLPFQTLIGEIEADIEDLDSAAEQPMIATLNGSVDGYAPVVIEASGRPLGNPRDARLELRFRGMDIATMSPYSGTYAGYTIDSGTLSVDLVYAVDGTELEGDNRIIISQMELGEPIESERAMQLPLKLGIALLTDAQGVIDLAVPISGDIDDPKFSLAGVIAGAIGNVIVKAATAPFRLLAGLVNSEEDLENISFEAGSDELDDSSRSALDALASALEQRPKLQLRVIGSTDPAADRRALQAQVLQASLVAEGIGPEAIASAGDAYVAAIGARYAALGLPAPEDGSEVALETQVEAVQSRIELPQGRLQELGTSRATAAKRELVTAGGVDAARIAVAYDKSLLMTGAKMSLDG